MEHFELFQQRGKAEQATKQKKEVEKGQKQENNKEKIESNKVGKEENEGEINEQ